jgi:NAD(P)H-flavin reductase
MKEYTVKKYNILREPMMSVPPNFHRKSVIMNTDRSFKSELINIIQLTEMEKLFHVRILDAKEREAFFFRPGQFVMLELPGYGEVPISISSSVSNKGYIELCIRKAGLVTGLLHRAKRGTKVGLRGPFGTHFPLAQMKGFNMLLIAGGLGLAPLRAPLFYVNENRNDYEDVHILYGTKHPDQLLFDYQYEEWQKIDDVDLHLIVEKPDKNWNGKVGLITELFNDIKIDFATTYAIVCGPPVMFKFVCNYLYENGLPMHRMFVSLERRMHCGMGKCCRCNIGSTFTCLDGPVFDYWSVMNLKEAI